MEIASECALPSQPPELSRHVSWPVGTPPLSSRCTPPSLQRSHSHPVGSDVQALPSALPALEVLLRRGLHPQLAKAFSIREHAALPTLDPRYLKWATDRNERMEGIEGILYRLEQKLTGWMQELSSSLELGSHLATDEIQIGLQEARELLSGWSPQGLASVACRLHARVFTLCVEIERHILGGLSVECDAEPPTPLGATSTTHQHEAARELSREQREIVECPRSIFVQGRSGTGKTLVITRRMLDRRAKVSHPLSQVFVTKSSLLRNEVARDLESYGTCLVQDWPPSGTMCVTWDQLIATLGVLSSATINFNLFLESYWPRLRGRARQLPPQLVWAEFNTRLRPFRSSRTQVDLTLEEYLQNDMAAVGIRMERDDQLAMYEIFKTYIQLKKSSKHLDDVDVASKALSFATPNAVDELYVDEAQDFAPLELMVLIALCRDPDGITVAGDTCQTINPGSSFSFHDILDAFYDKWSVREAVPGDGSPCQETVDARACQERAQKCQMLTLHYNYRCAPGVAGLAGSVVQFLLRCFPSSADYVREEMLLQQVRGLPVVAELPGANLDLCIKGSGELPVVDSSRVAILVRSDKARSKLRDRLGSFKGIPILTVAESKGLEFELVIICNFLSDCPDNLIWNLINEQSLESKIVSMALGAQDLIYGSDAVAKLENKHHRILCRMIQAIPDLKTLYVAITRARAGCCIMEDRLQPEVFDPLVSLWKDKGLVERWSGMEDYSRATAVEPQAVEPQATTIEHDDAETTEQDMIEWLSGQLAARIGQSHKKARNIFAKERRRLQDGGCMDSSFRKTFEATHGVVQGGAFAVVKRPAEIQDVPSLLPFMEKRFCNLKAEMDLGALVQDLKARGQQLLQHALDDVRERWQIFAEARRLFLEGVRMDDIAMATQMRYASRSGEAPQHAVEIFERPNATAHSYFNEIAACMRGVFRPCSWRGRPAGMRKLLLWKHIFSYLAPVDIEDPYNSIALIAERMAECAVLRQELGRQATLSWAWYLFSSSQYDMSDYARGDMLKASLENALRAEMERRKRVRSKQGHEKFQHEDTAMPSNSDKPTITFLKHIFSKWNALACGGLHKAAAIFYDLQILCHRRAQRCAEAGRAFLALQMHELAVQAHAEAARNFQYCTRLLEECPLGEKLTLISGRHQAAEEHATSGAQSEFVLAAQCALLIAPGGPSPATRIGRQALSTAATYFDSGGLVVQACLCRAQAGQLRAALAYLMPKSAAAEIHCISRAVGLLCAALLGELPQTAAGIAAQREAVNRNYDWCKKWREREHQRVLAQRSQQKREILKAMESIKHSVDRRNQTDEQKHCERSEKQHFERELQLLHAQEMIDTRWNLELKHQAETAMACGRPLWFKQALDEQSEESDAVCRGCGIHVYVGLGSHIWNRCHAVSSQRKDWIQTLPKSSQALIQCLPWRLAKTLFAEEASDTKLSCRKHVFV